MAKSLPWQLRIAVAFAVVLCLSQSCSAAFDYFLFTREWPGTFCDYAHCKIKPKNESAFTIHGLWPQYNNNSWPQFCNHAYPYDESEIKDLLAQMEDDWPSLLLSDFWKHEWEKHGTCSLDVFPHEHEYFSAALKLHKSYDLQGALAAEGIVPHPFRRYSVHRIQDAFRKHLGTIPQLECTRGMLNEVRMCVSKDLKPFSCGVTSRTCPVLVKLPPFPDRALEAANTKKPCKHSMGSTWNVAPAAQACPFMVGALLLGSVATLGAVALIVARKKAALAASSGSSFDYAPVPGSDSKLPTL